MLLSKSLQDKLMDLRLRDRLIAEGKLKSDEINKYLSQLQDDSKNMTDSEVPDNLGDED